MLFDRLHLIRLVCQLMFKKANPLLKTRVRRVGVVEEAQNQDERKPNACFQQGVFRRRWRQGCSAFFGFQAKHRKILSLRLQLQTTIIYDFSELDEGVVDWYP